MLGTQRHARAAAIVLRFDRPGDTPAIDLLRSVENDVPVYWLIEDICGPSRCQPANGDVFLYRDRAHLTVEGSRYLGRKHAWRASLKPWRASRLLFGRSRYRGAILMPRQQPGPNALRADMFGFETYHIGLAGVGLAILLAFWLPRFISGREPAASALLILVGLLAFLPFPGVREALIPVAQPRGWEIMAEICVIVGLFGTGLRIDRLDRSPAMGADRAPAAGRHAAVHRCAGAVRLVRGWHDLCRRAAARRGAGADRSGAGRRRRRSGRRSKGASIRSASR